MSVCVCGAAHTHTHTPTPLLWPTQVGIVWKRGALLAAIQLGSITGPVLPQSAGCASPPWQTKRSLCTQLLTVSYPPRLQLERQPCSLSPFVPSSQLETETMLTQRMSFNMWSAHFQRFLKGFLLITVNSDALIVIFCAQYQYLLACCIFADIFFCWAKEIFFEWARI